MAALTPAVRNSLPAKAFLDPSARKYPVFTRAGNSPIGKVVFSRDHALSAIGRAKQGAKEGWLTPLKARKIRQKAYKILRKHDALKTAAARKEAEAFGEFPFTKCNRPFNHPQVPGVPIREPVMQRGSAPRFAPKGAKMRDYSKLADGAGYVARQDLHPVTQSLPNDRRNLAMREWGGKVQASLQYPGWGGGSQFGRQFPWGSSEQPGWPGTPGLSSAYGPVFPYIPKPYAQFGGRADDQQSLFAKWNEGAPLSNTALNKLSRAGLI